MNSLIDRYVFTVLRRVPEQQRSDIEQELRTSIDDAVDARVGSGEAPDTAVEQALLELGDPDRLADGYAGRPRYLIGPEFYQIWRRMLVMLLSTVLPVVVTVAAVIRVLDQATIGEVIGTVVGTALTVGAHMVFWVTLIFALLDRAGVAGPQLRRKPWSPDDLPHYEAGFLTPANTAAAVVWPVLLIAGLVLQQFGFTEAPVLDPANWSFWWPYLIGVLILEALYPVWLLRRGAWTHTATAVNAALAVLFAAPVIWLAATGRFFNPEWIASLNWGATDPLDWLTGVVIVITVLAAIWDVVEVGVRAERARRGLATPVPGTGREFTSPLS
ncbi:permease prefix domain 1-containing protein [Actinoplanes sp. NEAU-A12]|uniref:Permease prefix domain 1-containing protein n=1 Tax=Actinoplanes sandaracinus TaxID=3045177 RepID=A0ABT6WUQ1_9ACTN|nr:permease prefix domain 1-containing protein [Actinoplanes sandaracinus]MDI6103440.1 permease prefix domain 1-containing protein [Actinoplanes sandaracinus]